MEWSLGINTSYYIPRFSSCLPRPNSIAKVLIPWHAHQTLTWGGILNLLMKVVSMFLIEEKTLCLLSSL
jgi:hypothetical protein